MGLLGLLVEGVGQVKDAARQLPLFFILFYLHSVGVGINLISAASLLVTPVKSEISASPLLCVMSRTGRGGGRGGFGGRPSFGANNPPPMGLTSADIQAMSREQSALYPVRPHSPSCTFILTALRICFVAHRVSPCTDRVF